MIEILISLFFLVSSSALASDVKEMVLEENTYVYAECPKATLFIKKLKPKAKLPIGEKVTIIKLHEYSTWFSGIKYKKPKTWFSKNKKKYAIIKYGKNTGCILLKKEKSGPK